jgi:hypothetical protein
MPLSVPGGLKPPDIACPWAFTHLRHTMASHSWENPGRVWEAGGHLAEPDENSAELPIDDVFLEGDAATEQLAEMLLSLYFSATLSAKQVCVLSWWCARSGLKGVVKS